ncbi:MAG: Spy/CpxP family protein refolding chaperone [Tepidimonas sp.]|nr:Spy/CpxP family protein refolding chaperone [Tepidimonas sp.]
MQAFTLRVRRWAALGAAVCLAASASAWARGPQPGGPGGPDLPPGPHAMIGGPGEAPAERMAEHLTRGLDLQPAQREQVQTLARAAMADLRALREEGRALREERHRLLAAPNLDEAALEALRQRELAHHDKLSARMQRFMLDVAKVLTPQQRQRWAERLQRRGGPREAGPHPHEHPHPAGR